MPFQETVIDEHYVLVKAELKVRLKQGDAEPVEALLDSTFLLLRDGQSLRIVLHLESEDLAQAMRDRGIMAPESQ